MAGSARPIAVATWQFGEAAVKAAGEALRSGSSALDAVERGINVTELDPEVASVGYGGLPNADGVVQLDAAIMSGANLGAGSVVALQDVRTPISVARKVMEESRHVMLAGDGARAFALQHGFTAEELLTDAARARWLERQAGPAEDHDTIGLVALDAGGSLAAGCSTSGLPWKLPGRVGDSPLVGSGLYADNEAGAAAATGVGEEIIRVCASFLAVELMRAGASPADACREVIERCLRRTAASRQVPVALIALAPDGTFGAATTRDEFQYAVWTSQGTRLLAVAGL